MTHAKAAVPRAAVIGAGSWGTALAIHLARAGVDTILRARRPEAADALRRNRENAAYLPGCPFPDLLRVTADLAEALEARGLVLFVAPAQSSREIFRQWCHATTYASRTALRAAARSPVSA